MRPEVQSALTRRHPGIHRLHTVLSGKLHVVWNEELETPHRIFSDGLTLAGLTQRAIATGIITETPSGPGSYGDPAFRRFLDAHPDLFSTNISETLALASQQTIGSVSILRYGQTHNDIPELNGRVHAVIHPNVDL